MTDYLPLPQPNLTLTFPLIKAIEQRRTIRKWSDQPIDDQDLANILWAACGITKEPKGKSKNKRTVPSACNSQEIKVYAVMKKGTFLYDENAHALLPVCSTDIRKDIGSQKMMQSAPLGLIYVADLSYMKSPILKKEEAKRFSAWVDTGFVSQNVYLYCAAANLATAVLALVKRDVLSRNLGLNDQQKIVLTQVIGHRSPDR